MNVSASTYGDESEAGTVCQKPKWQEQALWDLQNTAMSYQDIATKYGRDPDTIRKLKERHHIIKMRKKPGPKSIANSAPLSAFHKALGINVGLYRAQKNLTIQEVAHLLNVSSQLVRYIEAGIEDPSLSLILRVCSLIELDLEAVLRPHRVPRASP